MVSGLGQRRIVGGGSLEWVNKPRTRQCYYEVYTIMGRGMIKISQSFPTEQFKITYAIPIAYKLC